MLTEGAGDFLHRLDAGAHGLPAPFIEELASPGGRVVIPELLEGFLEKVSPDGLQVVAEKAAQAEALLNLQVLFPLEQEPCATSASSCSIFKRKFREEATLTTQGAAGSVNAATREDGFAPSIPVALIWRPLTPNPAAPPVPNSPPGSLMESRSDCRQRKRQTRQSNVWRRVLPLRW
jgi:hypothetical protein